MRSFQTPDTRGFCYNPFADAKITVFPIDGNPRVFNIKATPFSSDHATACDGRIQLTYIDGNITCHVNGKATQRFSVTFRSKRKKQRFAKY